MLAEYVKQATTGGAGADGLLQRFGLMVYPDISPNWKEVDRYPDGKAKQAVNQLAEYLDRRIYASATRPDIDSAKTILNKLNGGKLDSPFKARDIYRKGWTGLDTSQKAQSAIDLLIEYCHLTVEEIITGGRPTAYYHWNEGTVL